VPNEEYLTKTQVLEEVMRETGAGRWVIERKIDELEEAGQIKVITDPADLRRKRISRTHVQVIIRSLQIA
jgi:DNA-binding MarR family transcriptional regulator